MGVHGLYDLINKRAPSGITQETFPFLSGKSAALDANLFMCRFLYGANGTTAKDIERSMEAFYEAAQKYGLTLLFVFDGEAPPEKLQTQIARAKKRQLYEDETVELDAKIAELMQEQRRRRHEMPTMEQIEQMDAQIVDQTQVQPAEQPAVSLVDVPIREWTDNQIDDKINQLIDERSISSKRAQKLTREMSKQVYDGCREKGIPCVISSSEADFLMARLAKEGIVDFLITDDGDCIVHGAPMVLRGVKEHFKYLSMQQNQQPTDQSNDNLIDNQPIDPQTDDQQQENGQQDQEQGEQQEEVKGKTFAVYHYDKILQALKITADQLVELAIISGHDDDDTIENIGSITAWKLIQEYKTVEHIVQAIRENKIGVSKTALKAASSAIKKQAKANKKQDQNNRQHQPASKKSKSTVSTNVPSNKRARHVVPEIDPSSLLDHKEQRDQKINQDFNMVDIATIVQGTVTLATELIKGPNVQNGSIESNRPTSPPVPAIATGTIVVESKFKYPPSFLESYPKLRTNFLEAPCTNDLTELAELVNYRKQQLVVC